MNDNNNGNNENNNSKIKIMIPIIGGRVRSVSHLSITSLSKLPAEALGVFSAPPVTVLAPNSNRCSASWARGRVSTLAPSLACLLCVSALFVYPSSGSYSSSFFYFPLPILMIVVVVIVNVIAKMCR